MDDDRDHTDRGPGRRPLDLAPPLLRWLPFMTLLTIILGQTVFVTRYVSGIETSNAQLIATVTELKAELKGLSASVSQSAIPSATMTLRIEYVEARVNELRAMANDNSRRITQLETGRVSR